MPLKLIPPREGKSPNFTVRGTYLGQYVDRSAGSKYPPAKPGALDCEPLKAAMSGR